MSIFEKKYCRLCEGDNLSVVANFGVTPLANDFFAEKVEYFTAPLILKRCEACGHVQLAHVVSPDLLFSEYAYESGTSASFRQHFQTYGQEILEELDSEPSDLCVLDVGCNDGTLLEFLSQSGVSALGIDPASNMVDVCKSKGLSVIKGYFDLHFVETQFASFEEKVDLISANNVFAHIDDLSSAFESAKFLLKPDGQLVFEVSYLADVLEHDLFDTVYHEHLDYHHVTAIDRFCARKGMTLRKVDRIPSHGGSIRCWVTKGDKKKNRDGSVKKFLKQESHLAFDDSGFRNWFSRLSMIGKRLRDDLNVHKKRGGRVIAFGAPAKFTTFTHFFGIEAAHFDDVLDESILKIGKYTPGGNYKIQDAQSFSFRSDDLVVVTAWNFAVPIIKRYKTLVPETVRWITPLPDYKFD